MATEAPYTRPAERGLTFVSLSPEPLDRFAGILEIGTYDRLLEFARQARELLAGRVIWNVSSTARGGGVAEMLIALLPLARGAGADARWAVIDAPSDFFRITKRIHNHLQGTNPDGGELGPRERARYESVLGKNAAELGSLVGPRDIVILHDPQTAGLVPALRGTGAKLVWRCHIGSDAPNAEVRCAWDFLAPYVEVAHGYVFSRAAHVWDCLDRAKAAIIPPSIDVFSAKNESLAPDQVSGILAAAEISIEPGRADANFVRGSGKVGRVERRAEFRRGRVISSGARLMTQISRWDRLKDPAGLIRGFVEHVAPRCDVHLILAGPQTAAVSDDPEGAEVLHELETSWDALPAAMQERVHLVCLPMVDIEENAAIVNALQRRAAIVVQKSLAEGFGLTVAEAMWKARPIVASRVGGIQDQLEDGVSGLLVEPTDLAAFGRAAVRLLDDEPFASALGAAARRKCYDEYLAPPHLIRYVRLFEKLLA